MKVIGVTGGIGSGKSTVSGILADMGAEVIDADKIARSIVGKGEKALEEIVRYFGREILDSEGALDRGKLSSIVFDNAEGLRNLNAITHKYIAQKILDDIVSLRNKNASLIVIDAAIPIEHGFLDAVDEVWVVTTSLEKRIERVMERSCLNRQEVMSRIESQKSDEEYLAVADRVIVNEGSLNDLRMEVKKIIGLG